MSEISPELRHTEDINFTIDNAGKYIVSRPNLTFYRDEMIFLEHQDKRELDLTTVIGIYPELTPLAENEWEKLGFYFGISGYRPADVAAMEQLGIWGDEIRERMHADMGAEVLLEVSRSLKTDEMPTLLEAIIDGDLRQQVEARETEVTGISAWVSHIGLRLHVMTSNDLINVGFAEPYNLDWRSSDSDLDESYLSNSEWEALVRTYEHLRSESYELLR